MRRNGLTGTAALVAAITEMQSLATAGGRHPLLAAWMADPSAATPDEQFRLSLTFLLDGIAGRLRAG